MKIQISLSAKQVGQLYHYTTKQALLKILRSGNLALSTGRAMGVEQQHQSGKNFFASFTRSRFGGYHYQEGGRRSLYGDTNVLITIDGDLLSSSEQIAPVDYWGNRGKTDKVFDRSKENEERLVSDHQDIPFLRYIQRVDLILPAVQGDIETYGMDKGKYKLTPNDRQQKLLGSIILQLKKHKIKYGFYDSVDDWARKRNEYTYTGPKDVSIDTRSGYGSNNSYKHLLTIVEALSDSPYEKLSKPAQKICDQLSRYPNDVDSVFNDYENFRKPDANPTFRAAALKVARVMQRRGFNTKVEAGKFMAEKANVYAKAEQKKFIDERNVLAAPLLVAALTLPIEQWPDHQNQTISPKRLFLGITDRWSYMYGEAERTVNSILTTHDPEVYKLLAVMRELGLQDGADVVSKIYYDKVKPYNEQKTTT